VRDDLLHELHRGVYAAALAEAGVPHSCDDCEHDLDCHEPIGLTSKGGLTHRPDTDPATVVSWPGCPNRWHVVRRLGGDLMPLSSCVQWGVARGWHRGQYLGGGGARLYREWLRTKDSQRRILKARAYDDAKNKRGQS